MAHFDPEFKDVIENFEAGRGGGRFQRHYFLSTAPAKRVQNPKITANLDIWPEIIWVVIFYLKAAVLGSLSKHVLEGVRIANFVGKS